MWRSLGLLLTLASGLMAQPFSGRITGRVLDAETQQPLEYASVILYRLPDTSQVTGAATDARGLFVLSPVRPGQYLVSVDFLGYRKQTLGPVSLTKDHPHLNLGTVLLKPSVLTTEPVEVQASAPPVTFKIDKRVVHVGRQATTSSATALEVLETVPSVTVDPDGQVYLRGSSNFTLLIDGRPTLLDPSDALAQIPASAIDRIEIITSPSARYDPEGEVGILNVILKKRRTPGLGGQIHLHAGLDQKYGGDALVNRRSGPINLYLSGYANLRTYPGRYTGSQMPTTPEGGLERTATGSFRRRMRPYGLRGGIELQWGKSFLSLGGSWGRWHMERRFLLDYHEVWHDSLGTEDTYTTEDAWERASPSLSTFATLQHDFAGQEHRLSLDLYFTHRQASEHSYTLRYDGDRLTQGDQATEKGPSTYGQARLEYRRPLAEHTRVELGYQGSLHRSRTERTYALYDTLTGDFVDQAEYGYTLQFHRQNHALYGLLSHDTQSWGIQGGLRLETTHRQIQLVGEPDTFRLQRVDVFPSLHLSWQLPGQRQWMLGYSRRIRRPRSWWLEPYLTWLDPNNAHQGNPHLKPSYTHSVDLSFQSPIGSALLTIDAYGRQTLQRIERVQRPYGENAILHTFENVGTSEALGVETTVDLDPHAGWSLQIIGDAHRYWLHSGDDTRSSWNGSLRIRNEFQIGNWGQIQVHLRYRSPSVTSQGTRQGFTTLDLAWKYRWGRRLHLTLQVRDVLATGRWAFTSETGEWILHREFQRKAPMVSLSVRYVFNAYRPRRQPRIMPEESEGELDLF